MATDKQKEAARRNIGKARQAQSARAHGEDVPRSGEGLSTADKDKLADQEFAFPGERKEPLTDARHVRNAIARGVTTQCPGRHGRLPLSLLRSSAYRAGQASNSSGTAGWS